MHKSALDFPFSCASAIFCARCFLCFSASNRRRNTSSQNSTVNIFIIFIICEFVSTVIYTVYLLNLTIRYSFFIVLFHFFLVLLMWNVCALSCDVIKYYLFYLRVWVCVRYWLSNKNKIYVDNMFNISILHHNIFNGQ